MFKYLFLAYSSVFALESIALGILLALVSLTYPNSGVCGLLAVSFSGLCLFYLDSKNFQKSTIKSVSYNCLLVGLLVGQLFSLNLHILFLLLLLVIFTMLVTFALDSMFSRDFLPILSLPFFIVSMVVFLLSSQIYLFAHVPSAFLEYDVSGLLPDFAVYFFHSVSSILLFFSPTAGMLFWLAILCVSPLCAVFMLCGFFVGNSFESLFHEPNHNLSFYSNGLNYSLIFVMISGVFLTPSRFSILLATLATMITTLVVIVSSKIMNQWFLPVLSLPFCVVSLMVLLAVKKVRPSALSVTLSRRIEDNFINSNLLKKRHGFGEIGIFLPVKGCWKISQGFNGEFTHRGKWRYGLDFVAVNDKKESFINRGFELSDHFAFDQEIISPVEGWVFDCFDKSEDEKIGQVSNEKYGNYVILRSVYGIFVTLSHLKKDSLVVSKGDFVKVGQSLARCGNSGYSPEPHLHLQVQFSPVLGAETTPFHLLNYVVDQNIYFHRTPLRDEVLSDFNLNRISDKIFNFKIGQKFIFEGSDKKIVTIENKMDETSGEYYLTDGSDRIYHAKYGGSFYFYKITAKRGSVLCDLAIAALRVPLTYGKEYEYVDYLPVFLTDRFFSFGLLKKSDYKLSASGLKISGEHNIFNKKTKSFIEIDPIIGIREFSVANRKYTALNS